jgi:hypothetical protein
MSTWYKASSVRHLWATYRRLRRPVIWKLDSKGEIVMQQSSRGPVAALVALVRYWNSKPSF